MRAGRLIGILTLTVIAAGSLALNPVFALEYSFDFNELEVGFVFTPDEQPYADLGAGHRILIGGDGVPTVIHPGEGSSAATRAVQNEPYPGSLEGSAAQDLVIDFEGFRADRVSIMTALNALDPAIGATLIAYQKETTPDGETRWLKVDYTRRGGGVPEYITTELMVESIHGEGVIDRVVITRQDDPVPEMIYSVTARVWEGEDPGYPRDLVRPSIRIVRPADAEVVNVGTLLGRVEEDVCLASLTARVGERSLAVPFRANGLTAASSIRYDFAAALPLANGENTVTLTAEDAAGNRDEETFRVTYIPLSGEPDGAEAADHGFDLEGTGEDRLLIITPYHSYSGYFLQRDTRWLEYAYQYAEYKRNTGIPTEVLTLEQIERDYWTRGCDQPERVKWAIYDRVIEEGVRYVMLVGDVGLFPVRYIYRGYLQDGRIGYYDDPERDNYGDVWYGYVFEPNDMYYANLFHEGDPERLFDNWDGDRDRFYGETYRDNYQHDRISIVPDVAVGRIPCQTLTEFLRYLRKAGQFEQRLGESERINSVLIAEGVWNKKRDAEYYTDRFGSGWECSFLFTTSTEGMPWQGYMEDRGASSPVDIPAEAISDFVDERHPHFLVYRGHGDPGNWQEFNFNLDAAHNLSNGDGPSIVIASVSCETGQFASMVSFSEPPDFPVTAGSNRSSMAEAFLIYQEGGGVIYLGSVSGQQGMESDEYLDVAFLESIAGGPFDQTAGDAWLSGLDLYIRRNWEAFIREHSDSVETESDHPNAPVAWSGGQEWAYHSLIADHFFGDPSIRVNGGVVYDLEPPVTTAWCDPWINREDMERYESGHAPHRHEISFNVHDLTPAGAATEFRYISYPSLDMSGWRRSTDDGYPEILELELSRAREGSHAVVQYRSQDLLGNREELRTKTIGYDFTAPTSSLEIDGASVAGVPCSEEDEPFLLTDIDVGDASIITIRGTDECSNVRGIQYAWGFSSGWGRVHFGSFCRIEPPAFGGTRVLRYRAIDNAGNEGRELGVRITFPVPDIRQMELLLNGPPPDPDDFSPQPPPELDIPFELPFPYGMNDPYLNPTSNPIDSALNPVNPDNNGYYGDEIKYEFVKPEVPYAGVDPENEYEALPPALINSTVPVEIKYDFPDQKTPYEVPETIFPEGKPTY